tara:strand:+ start:2368 stop:4362 length:1995 start_codon:yes stop_codon:yes gene_type:complete
MVAEVKRPNGKKNEKSFFSSRYFTIILTVGSLVLTGLVGGLFEYLGGQLAQNAATSTDPFDNPQVDVFTEWRNRPDFIKLRAQYDGESKSFSFWDIGYWVDEVEGKIVGGENKYRFKYEDNPSFLDDNPWHWEVNLSDRQFQKLNERYLSEGFKLHKRQEFIGTDGKNRNQAIWRSNGQPQSKDEKVELLQTASSDSKNPNKGKPDYIVSAIGKAGFDALDKNGDGLMSFAEYPGPEQLKKSNPNVKLRFDKKDRNQDGSLSFKEWFQTRLLTHWYIDHNRDGVVSQAEYLREHEGMDSGVTGEAKAYFKFKDKDGNGELDEAEWMAGKQRPLEHWWKQFDRWWGKNNRNNSVAKDPLPVDPRPVTEKQDQVKNKSKINTLTAEQAAELVADTGHLQQETDLWIGSLTEINQDVARELAKLQCEILCFESLTTIDAGVAQELAKFQGKKLFLGATTTIDAEVAHELAKFQGDHLFLRLTAIDIEVAQELAKFQRGELQLDDLITIDEFVAKELAKFEGDCLNLWDLKNIDEFVAKELARSKANNLDLHDLRTIDKYVAQELTALRCNTLYLNQIYSIDNDTAQSVGNFQVDRLALSGLKSISKEAAQAFAKFKGELYLTGIRRMNKEIAQELSKFQGKNLYLNKSIVDSENRQSFESNTRIIKK